MFGKKTKDLTREELEAELKKREVLEQPVPQPAQTVKPQPVDEAFAESSKDPVTTAYQEKKPAENGGEWSEGKLLMYQTQLLENIYLLLQENLPFIKEKPKGRPRKKDQDVED